MRLNCQQAAEALWELLKENKLTEAEEKLTPDILLYEAAAQQAMLDFGEGTSFNLSAYSTPVRKLAIAFITQLFWRISQHDPMYRNLTWDAPNTATLAEQGRAVIAYEIRQTLAHQQHHATTPPVTH